MKDEIKEINIKIPGQILDYVDTKEHLLELFNYITNLQTIEQQYSAILSENAELENKITNLQEELEEQKRIEQEDFKTIQNLEEENERLHIQLEDRTYEQIKFQWKDYKSRNEKAREYIKDNEQEYGSLEDNEKIILDILNGDFNE